jgi:hypothetical protein
VIYFFVRYSATLHYPDCIGSNDWMIGQLVDNLEGSGRGVIEVQSCYLPGGTKENHLTRKPQ